MRVPCSSWARGFLRWRGTTADHLVVRSGTAATDGRRGQLVPEIRARQREHAPHTRPPPGQTPMRTPSNRLVAKVRVAGSSPVVRSRALLRGDFAVATDPVR